jgi:hypothetical protein
VTDQVNEHLAERSAAGVAAQLQASEAKIEQILWDGSLEESEALAAYCQERQAVERLLERCDATSLPACQALLAYVLLREDDLLFEQDGDVPASLKRMERAVALAEASGNAVQLGRCLMVLGERLALAERPEEASAAWDRCEWLGRSGDADNDRDRRQLLGWLLMMRVRQAMREEHLEHAFDLAQEAGEKLEEIDDEAGMGALYTILALLYEGLGRSAAEIAIARAEAGRWTARARARHKR